MAADGTARGRPIRAHEPGWHPDPARRALMRYRTEAGWTSHVLDWKGAPRLDDVNGTSASSNNGELRLMFLAGRTRRLVVLAGAGAAAAAAALVLLVSGIVLLTLPLLLLAAVLATQALVMRGFGVILNTEGVILRGWRTVWVRWPEVYAIEPHHRFGARRVRIELKSGTHLWTWAPFDDALAPDAKFDGRVRALQQWHLDHSPARNTQPGRIS